MQKDENAPGVKTKTNKQKTKNKQIKIMTFFSLASFFPLFVPVFQFFAWRMSLFRLPEIIV